MSATPEPRLTDIGPPHYEKYLHPLIKKNYGQWKYHENLAPGVYCHVAESGDRIYTVRAGTPRSAEHSDAADLCRFGRQIFRRLSALHQPQ